MIWISLGEENDYDNVKEGVNIRTKQKEYARQYESTDGLLWIGSNCKWTARYNTTIAMQLFKLRTCC